MKNFLFLFCVVVLMVGSFGSNLALGEEPLSGDGGGSGGQGQITPVNPGGSGGSQEFGPAATSSKFLINGIAKTLVNLKMRSEASLSAALVYTLPVGTQVLVVGGPKFADGYWWWQVQYGSSGMLPTLRQGWVVEDFITNTNSILPPVIARFEGPVISYGEVTSVYAGQLTSWWVQANVLTGNNVTYRIVWGDGDFSFASKSSGQVSVFTHTYSREGNFEVWMVATDEKGGTTVKSKIVKVLSNAPPSAGGDFSISSPVAGATYYKGTVLAVNWGRLPVYSGGAYYPVGLEANLLGPYNDSSAAPSSRRIITAGSEVNPNSPAGAVVGKSWQVATDIKDGLYVIEVLVDYSGNGSNKKAISGAFNIAASSGPGNPTTSTPPDGGSLPAAPVISGVQGPTSIQVNQSGFWTILASDFNNDVLTYEVNWGDGNITPAGTVSSLGHTYSTAGTYSLVFTVRDPGGLSATYPLKLIVTSQEGSGTTLAIGDRVQVTETVNVRQDPNGYAFGSQGVNALYSGFARFNPARGVVIEGPRTVGSYTWVKVNYDYGADGWSAVNYLSSLGRLTGDWEFMADGVLGRKIQPASGNVFTEPYYYFVEDIQVSIPGNMAQASLSSSALALQPGSGGSWDCQTIDRAGYRCAYKKGVPGNRTPVITRVDGSTSVAAGIQSSWTVIASDPDNDPLIYEVVWGDGSSGTGQTSNVFSHIFSGSGPYTLTFRVSDGKGGADEESVVVAIACSVKFQINNRVRVLNDAENGLNVRSAPGGALLGNQQKASAGTVVGGPQAQGDYCWWNVNYDTGADGWSAENWLEIILGSGGGGVGGVSVISPTSGEVWRPGETKVIRWTAPATVTKVHLYLSGVGSIAFDVPNTGSYSWTIPQVLNGRTLNGGTFSVSVYAADTGVSANSTSYPFSISSAGSAQGPSPAPSGGSGNTTSRFLVGDIVRTTENLNVRHTAGIVSGNVAGIIPQGTRGTLLEGPVVANLYLWWKVDFEGSLDGWVVEDFLELVSRPGGATQNQPPVFGAITGLTSLRVDELGTWQISATDSDSASLTYTVNWGDGTSRTYTGASGQAILASHIYGQVGAPTILVTVSDGQLSDSETIAITVTVAGQGQDQAPILDPLTTPTQATAGVSTSWQVRATDPEGLSLTYSVSWGDGSANSNYTGASGQAISVSHIYEEAGSKTVTVTVSDGRLYSVGYFTVTVTTQPGENQPPTAPSITGATSLTTGVAGSWQIQSHDPEGARINYSVNWGDGVVSPLDAPSDVAATISHTYGQAGARTITVIAVDAQGLSASTNYIVTINDPTQNPAGINILAPIGGETWNVYQTKTIQWTAPLSVNKVFVYLRIGSSISLIAASVPMNAGVGSYNWTIPPTMVSSAGVFTLGGSYKIEIIAENGTHSKVGNLFSIVNTGQKFTAGDRVRVSSFSASNMYATDPCVDLLYSGAQAYPSAGTVESAQPKYCNGGYWEEVDFDSGSDGWIAQNVLQKL